MLLILIKNGIIVQCKLLLKMLKSYKECVFNDRLSGTNNGAKFQTLNISEEPLKSLITSILENPEDPTLLNSLTETSKTSIFTIPRDIISLVFSNISEEKNVQESINFLSTLYYFPKDELRQVISIEDFVVLVNNMMNPVFIRPIGSIIGISSEFRQALVLSDNFSDFMEMITTFSVASNETEEIDDQMFCDAHFFLQCISSFTSAPNLISQTLNAIMNRVDQMNVMHQSEAISTFFTFYYYHREQIQGFDIVMLFPKIEANFNNANEELVTNFLKFIRLFEEYTDKDNDYSYDEEEEDYYDENFAERLFIETNFFDIILELFSETNSDNKRRILFLIHYSLYEVPSLIKKICENGFVGYLLEVLSDCNVSISTSIIRIFSRCIRYGSPEIVHMFLDNEILEIYDSFIANTSDSARYEINKALLRIVCLLKAEGSTDICDHIKSLDNLMSEITENDIFENLEIILNGDDEAEK